MLNFDIKELSNIKFSMQDLKDYYDKVKKYENLKWTPEGTDTLTHKVNKMYSWAIQSNLKDPTRPCPPYDIKHDDTVLGTFDNPTDLVFGFGKILIDAIPNIRQTVISAHPPGTIIQQHIDNVEYIKIHMPIETNNESYFSFGETNYNLKIGKAYIINTTRLHGTVNSGDTDRVHLIFKIPIKNVEEFLNTEWVLDSAYLDFNLIELSNLQFNLDNLKEYYDDIKNNFDYLRWELPKIFENNTGGLYGYGILTNKDNVDEATDPPGSRKDKKHYEPLIKPTKMLKGLCKKLYDQIPYMEELVITGHPTSTGIPPHVDKDEHVRIHLPIYSNEQSYFIINDVEYVLEVGKAYIVNTKKMHTTYNKGISDRIHLHFKIPIGKINQFLSKEIIL